MTPELIVLPMWISGLPPKGQHPIAVVLGCIDSRVPVETVFDMSFGDIFCIRIAANVINDDILASIEYACNVIGAKLVVILGHTQCGAIQAACNGVKKGHITQLLSKIKPAISAETLTKTNRNSQNIEFVKHVTDFNVANTLKTIYARSEILHKMINDNAISMVGAIYDVQTGKVRYKNYKPELLTLDGKESKQLADKLELVLKESKILEE